MTASIAPGSCLDGSFSRTGNDFCTDDRFGNNGGINNSWLDDSIDKNDSLCFDSSFNKNGSREGGFLAFSSSDLKCNVFKLELELELESKSRSSRLMTSVAFSKLSFLSTFYRLLQGFTQ